MAFADLGLDPVQILVRLYEFWSGTFVGRPAAPWNCRRFPHGAGLPIREELDRPQLVSTSRHLNQGAAELESVEWEIPCPVAAVVAGDGYDLVDPRAGVLALFSPRPPWPPRPRRGDGRSAPHQHLPCPATRPVDWRLNFKS
ncbi:MAG: hypothetical protein U1G05_12805 [Kiritimatiellia bacterium]